MENFYTVEYKRHNKVSGAWAYKSELGTSNIDEAYKKAYALLGEFVGGDTFDMVNVIMSDRNGLVLVNEKWEATAKPQPTVTTEDIVAKLIADGVISQSDIDTAKASLEETAE